jgi:hypothetical protein
VSASQASVVLAAVLARVATMSTADGYSVTLSTDRVKRGQPPVAGQMAALTPPMVYLAIDSIVSVPSTVGRQRDADLVLAWYVHAAATGSTAADTEAAALELAHDLARILHPVSGSPYLGGSALWLASFEVEANGSIVETATDHPRPWMAGILTIRYAVTVGGL